MLMSLKNHKWKKNKNFNKLIITIKTLIKIIILITV